MKEGIRDIRLNRLSLYQFKSYADASLEFDVAVVCFLGNNGAGKTNLLDAIHYLSFSKSYFNSVDAQNIAEGLDECSITGTFERGGLPEQMVCAWRKGQRKTLRRNGKEYDKLSQHIGLLPSVMITPYDIDLILEGSEVRRRFVDSTLSQVSPAYLEHLIQYNQALQQRNALLRQSARSTQLPDELLEPWDVQLIAHGEAIYEARNQFARAFTEVFAETYQALSQGREQPAFAYQSDLENDRLHELLTQSRQKDRMLERTTQGIHKDELNFLLDGRMLRKFGSQGQQKTYLIALKLAQLIYLREQTGLNPLLMLDDLYDKLDESRVHNLLHWLHNHHRGQLFITDTHPQRIPELLRRIGVEHEAWEVRDSRAVRINSAAVV